MNILGLESLVFGVDDVAGCMQFAIDYGLKPVNASAAGGWFEALDGTGIDIAARDAAHLPPSTSTTSMLRKTIYGVADRATLEAIAAELGRDRPVRRLADGSLEAEDDMGFVLGFQLSRRKAIPDVPAQRAVNVVAVDEHAIILPRTLSHVVYFVPDAVKAEAFYTERLGFLCTDRFINVGPFLRPAGMPDHHALFLIQTPPHMKGIEHFTFHLADASDVMQAGTRLVDKGYRSYWGPGRHKLGSNWFWYFNSPFGCRMEYDADMDLHDDHWTPRAVPMGADGSQVFLFQARERWVPGGPTAKEHA
jgi:catechol 2,3-dioxygenase-like lactoylglutathione lyase family enzyme